MTQIPSGGDPDATPTETVSPFARTPPAPSAVAGDLVGGRLGPYRIVEAVGRGGMGVVYRGQDEALDRPVALKVIADDVARDASFLDRLRREARATARLSHQNLAHVYAIGEEGGRHYFAMEFIAGRNLSEVLRSEGPLDPARAAGYIAQAARGLREAQRQGVIHRDVKPSNLMCSEDGIIKVTDFGLAKTTTTAGTGDPSITAAGTILGTPFYMSPEQGRGDRVDHRADIYSLGATCFHLIAGRPPYEADTPMGVVVRHVTDPVPQLHELRRDVPEPYQRVIARMLAKKPEERYPNYDELLADLDRLAGLKVVDVAQGAEITCGIWSRWLHAPSFRLPAQVQDLKPAGWVTRLSATALDHLIFVPLVATDLALGLLWKDIFGPRLLYLVAAAKGLFLFYYLAMHLRYGRSLGKWALDIQVFRSDGRPAGPGRMFARFLGSQLPLVFLLALIDLLLLESSCDLKLPFAFWPLLESHPMVMGSLVGVGAVLTGINLVTMILSRDVQGWHDRLAGTRVVHRHLRRTQHLEETGLRPGADPVIALALSIIPGAGHFYLGLRAGGAAIFLGCVLAMPALHGAARAYLSDGPLKTALAGSLLGLALVLWPLAAAHAWLLARRAAPENAPGCPFHKES